MTNNLLAPVKNQLFYLWFSTSTTTQAQFGLDRKFWKNHLKYHEVFFNKHITSILAPEACTW